jgi:hypothetical protein
VVVDGLNHALDCNRVLPTQPADSARNSGHTGGVSPFPLRL